VLASVLLAVITCLLLGLAVVMPEAYAVAIPFLVLGFLAMLTGIGYYIWEVTRALAAVQNERQILAHLHQKVELDGQRYLGILIWSVDFCQRISNSGH